MDASLSVPMIEIDVPFFKLLKQQKLPLTLFFTNPQTVEGTLKRLYTYVTREVEVVVIPKAFDLLMASWRMTKLLWQHCKMHQKMQRLHSFPW